MAFSGVLCKLSADAAIDASSGFTAIAWDGADVYDTHALHDPSSSNTKIIVPVGLNGARGRLRATVYLSGVQVGTSSIALVIKKNGVIISGYGCEGGSAEGVTSIYWLQSQTHPITLATGDEFTAELFNPDDNAMTIEVESSTFGLQVLVNQIAMGVLCKLNADQTTANYSTPTVIAWNGTDVYDTDGAHDPSSNNSKIIIPAAWDGRYGIVRALTQLSLVTAGSDASLAVMRGGTHSYDGWGGMSIDVPTLTDGNLQAFTQPIQLSTGQEFEARLHCADTSITVQSERCSFGLWIVG